MVRLFREADPARVRGPRQDRVVAFQDGSSTNWLFAYEDGTDFDYNDMAVKVEPVWEAGKKSGKPRAHLESHRSEVADALQPVLERQPRARLSFKISR